MFLEPTKSNFRGGLLLLASSVISLFILSSARAAGVVLNLHWLSDRLFVHQTSCMEYIILAYDVVYFILLLLCTMTTANDRRSANAIILHTWCFLVFSFHHKRCQKSILYIVDEFDRTIMLLFETLKVFTVCIFKTILEKSMVFFLSSKWKDSRRALVLTFRFVYFQNKPVIKVSIFRLMLLYRTKKRTFIFSIHAPISKLWIIMHSALN
mgnify:CR=1 FL=1